MCDDLKLQDVLHIDTLHTDSTKLRNGRTRLNGKNHERVVVIPQHCPRMASNGRYVNHEPIHVKAVQTSSNSYSPCGVFGREGATDSAARRPIMKARVREGEEENAEFSVQHFRGKMRMPSGKGITHS